MMTTLGKIVMSLVLVSFTVAIALGLKREFDLMKDAAPLPAPRDSNADLQFNKESIARGAHFTLFNTDGHMDFFDCDGTLILSMSATGVQKFAGSPKAQPLLRSKLERAMVSIARQDKNLCDLSTSLSPLVSHVPK